MVVFWPPVQAKHFPLFRPASLILARRKLLEKMAQTLQEFAAWSSQGIQQAPAVAFEIVHEKFLRVNLGCAGCTGAPLEYVWMKMGSMVAYTGSDIKFTREGVMEHGFGHALKKAFTDEGATLVRASCKSSAAGRTQLYLADEGKQIALIRLAGDAVVVNGNDLLAFEPNGIKHKITMMRKLSSIVSGGLFNVRLEGHGFVAILTHGKPITLPVVPGGPPVFSDPQATVAWSGNLSPDFHTDVSFKTFIGRSSGESFQMRFVAKPNEPYGFVIIQPFEELPPPPPSQG